jgi:hypothetical protein
VAFFEALWIQPLPVTQPSIIGHRIRAQNLATNETVYLETGLHNHAIFYAETGEEIQLEIASVDAVGAGPYSTPIVVSVNSLQSRDIPEDLIEESPLIKNLGERLTDAEGNLLDQGAQIETLSDEITLKVQRRTSDGKYVVTGIGAAIGEDGQSEIGILADIFRMHTTVDGESQAIFVVDGPSGKMYLLGDLIADGSILANHIEADAIKTLLVNAGVAFIDHANILRVKAESIVVGQGYTSGIVATKPPGHLWHFDRHLSSTDGVAPTQATGTSIVPEQGIAGGALEVASGGAVRYDLPAAMDTWTWAGFFSTGE